MSREITLELIKNEIRNVPDFPKKGIQFKDITTVLKQADLFSFVVDKIAEFYKGKGITKVVCIESRGFILGGAVAAQLSAGFVPIRKPGKLPAATFSKDYELEYGMDSIQIHTDAVNENDSVLLHDDLLATGGTARAAIELLGLIQPKEIFLSFFCELDFLSGRKSLEGFDITSLIHF